MAGRRRKFDAEFREGAVRIVAETGKPIAQVAQDVGINETTLASWVSRARRAGGATAAGESEELAGFVGGGLAGVTEHRRRDHGRTRPAGPHSASSTPLAHPSRQAEDRP
ncbi:transposase [Streptomyces sp. NPDC048179]|uniref:transposase n=1 Tax=Streptomyces sp. NPDC048179 TaxID=3365506 RepID=UPI0037126C67